MDIKPSDESAGALSPPASIGLNFPVKSEQFMERAAINFYFEVNECWMNVIKIIHYAV